jgi:hypothetical protein
MEALLHSPLFTAGLAALTVLTLPGLVWLALLWRRDGDTLEMLAQAVGLSLSLSILAGVALFFLQVYFPGAGLLPLYAMLAAVLLTLIALRNPPLGRVRPRALLRGTLLGCAAAGLVLALALWRWYQSSALLLPAWVDSLHHTVIVQLIARAGGIPATFAPFFDAPLSYHLGFHYSAALFAQLTGWPAAQSVLWFGQLLNALIGLSVYRLARVLWKPRWAALLAALLVGLAYQMPAYYVSWGRYTLSAGLVLLPLAMAQALLLLRQPLDLRAGLNMALLTAGVALTHLTALYLLGLFVGWLLLERAAGALMLRIRKQPGLEPGLGLWLAAAALIGVMLALPWLLYMLPSYQSAVRVNLVAVGSDQQSYLDYLIYLIGPLHNEVLLGAGGLGLLWALRRAQTRPLALWGLTLTLLALPWGLRLGPFRPDHMAILLFLPAALLLAGLLSDLGTAAWASPRPLLRWGGVGLAALLGLAALGWGAWNTRSVRNASTDLVNAADLQAVDWIAANTPADARFLVNATVWMNTTYRGVDGGYWLETLTGRKTQIPPALYTLAAPEAVARITRENETAARLTTCDADFWGLVREARLSYLYVRSGTGSLQPAALETCAGVDPIYARDGVYLYALTPPAE